MLSRIFRYTALPTDQEQNVDETSRNNLVPFRRHFKLLLSFLVIFATFLGFIAGTTVQQWRDAPAAWEREIHRVPVDFIRKELKYQKVFGAAPSPDGSTEEAWDSLIPKGQGFVRYPPDAPNKSAVSVVHQLHCLYSIRLVLFSNLPNRTFDITSHMHGHHDLSARHMRHCFDLLRQGLMCCGDSSLEPLRPEIGGVTGWDFPRACKNYDQIKAFAEQYRTNDLEGFSGHAVYPEHPLDEED